MGFIGRAVAPAPITASDVPDLPASKITSGAFDSARLTNATFDDNNIVNDLSTLGLRVHSQENLNASNTNSASFDVFQDDSGIDTETNTDRDANEYVSSISITNAYETGDRTSSYTVSQNSLSARTASLSNWINGSNSANESGSWYFNQSGSNLNGSTITFDLGSGNSKVYTGARIRQDNASYNCGNWRWQVSNDGSSYTDITSTFTWGNATLTEQTWTNETAYRYIRLEGQAGATDTASPYQQEVEFRVQSTTANATGNFTGTTITASSSVSSMGAVITYQDHAGTNSLNTDIILKLSADNGSNYSTATLTALPDFATGIKMAKVNDLSVTAGTQLKYKIEFANQSSGSKEARIRGVSLQY